MARLEKALDEGAAGPFGVVVWNALQEYERRTGRRITIEMVADEGGFDYSHLHGVVKGKRGGPVKPRPDTATKLIETLEHMGVLISAEEALAAADLVPEGYKLVRVTSEPPENFADWPSELQEALSFTNELTPEVQVYIYKLWREQARAHADIEYRRREAERQLIQREDRLRQERTPSN